MEKAKQSMSVENNFPKKCAPKRKFKCNPYTFGGSKASICLSEILNSTNNPKICEAVSRFYHMSSKVFKDLNKLGEHKEMLMKLYYAHIEQCIDVHENWPEIVKSLTKNVIWAQYKKYIKNNLIIEFGD